MTNLIDMEYGGFAIRHKRFLYGISAKAAFTVTDTASPHYEQPVRSGRAVGRLFVFFA